MTVFSAVYLAVGILDTFPFFLATQKDSPNTEATVAGLPSVPYTVSGNLQARERMLFSSHPPKSWFVWPACAH